MLKSLLIGVCTLTTIAAAQDTEAVEFKVTGEGRAIFQMEEIAAPVPLQEQDSIWFFVVAEYALCAEPEMHITVAFDPTKHKWNQDTELWLEYDGEKTPIHVHDYFKHKEYFAWEGDITPEEFRKFAHAQNASIIIGDRPVYMDYHWKFRRISIFLSPSGAGPYLKPEDERHKGDYEGTGTVRPDKDE